MSFKVNKPEIITPLKALQKAQKFCAYSERSHFDLKLKLKEWQVDQASSDWIISELIQENFLNEERFAYSYCRGKLNQNKWGKYKIKHGLRKKQVSEFLIKKALEQISDEVYFKIMEDEVLKYIKGKNINNRTDFQKTIHYLNQKGFESEFVIDILKKIKNAKDGL
ncbi:MAG: regulatory protein RecX [Bacteroidales bacterium]|nr:regulatory protein RecX [Bacteroidales bacterium]MDY0215475.1 regulatory protein RecX [Bacteroidales bacterium]